MTELDTGPSTLPELDLTDPEVLRDPFGAYRRLRETGPVARLVTPGFGALLALTGYADARAMLTDPRFGLAAHSYLRPDVPEHCQPYLRTMGEMDGPEHVRLRRLVSPAFTTRRAAEFRPRIERIVDRLVDELPAHAEDGTVDLLRHFATPLPMDVICELVGVPETDRPRWREYGAAVAAGHGDLFAKAIPEIIDGARATVASRTLVPDEDLVSRLIQIQAEDGDRLTETELVTLVWHLVLAGQTPTNLLTNAVEALLRHPDQLALLRADPDLVPGAVEELTRWCGPQLLTVPRFPSEDVEVAGVRIGKGEPVSAALAAVNRDPRIFTDPERLDLTRPPGPHGHLGYGHGPHFCLGAPLARVQVEVALAALLRRFPDLTAATPPQRMPDPGTWRLTSLRLILR